MHLKLCSCAAGVVMLGLTTHCVRAEGPAPFMMLTQVGGHTIEGQPLDWGVSHMYLLGRDGQLHVFHPRAAQKSKKTSLEFRRYSNSEMHARLEEEFGREFEISTTPHFVVVHPRGQWRAWADRLELLYRSFSHSMQGRGFRIREPQVPLVAVVFLNQSEYNRHASKNGKPLSPGTLGHYDPKSNRIFLFDAVSASSDDWALNADTIIHEATHQTAYNVGVHRRFAEQPRWLVEGLATMYEARGVWDADRSKYTQAERINYGRFSDFRHYQTSRPSGMIKAIVSSDQLFRTNVGFAYAEAWTLTFFLCETQPDQYCRYLATVAARRPFQEYPATERVADFMRVFGSDFESLEAEVWEFVEKL